MGWCVQAVITQAKFCHTPYTLTKAGGCVWTHKAGSQCSKMVVIFGVASRFSFDVLA